MFFVNEIETNFHLIVYDNVFRPKISGFFIGCLGTETIRILITVIIKHLTHVTSPCPLATSTIHGNLLDLRRWKNTDWRVRRRRRHKYASAEAAPTEAPNANRKFLLFDIMVEQVLMPGYVLGPTHNAGFYTVNFTTGRHLLEKRRIIHRVPHGLKTKVSSLIGWS